MSKYTAEERQRIYDKARAAIEGAEEALAKPRPAAAAWPPCETRFQKWRREADEEAARFEAERRASTLTETEAQRLEQRLVAQFGAGLDQQKDLLLAVLAHSLAEFRDDVLDHLDAKVATLEQKVAELSAEVGSLRAEATIARAHKAEVVDLPALPLRKRVA